MPTGTAALLSLKLVTGATLKVYEGAPLGMGTTHKDPINADLLALIKGGVAPARRGRRGWRGCNAGRALCHTAPP